MQKLGWCMTGHHANRDLKGPGTNCPGRAPDDHSSTKDPCGCECHTWEPASEESLQALREKLTTSSHR